MIFGSLLTIFKIGDLVEVVLPSMQHKPAIYTKFLSYVDASSSFPECTEFGFR